VEKGDLFWARYAHTQAHHTLAHGRKGKERMKWNRKIEEEKGGEKSK
jgi:hypothetical protein